MRWARLMTLKWTVVRLEVEHGRYRRLHVDERHDRRVMAGVDYVGLERSIKRRSEMSGYGRGGLGHGSDEMHNAPAWACRVY